MENVLQWPVAWLLTYAIHSTILLGAAAVIAGRRNRKVPLIVRDTVWKAALVGGLTTATIQNVAGIRPWASPSPTDTSVSGSTVNSNAALDQSFEESTVGVPDNGGEQEFDVVSPSPSPDLGVGVDESSYVRAGGTAPGNQIDWVKILMGVWVVGALAGILKLTFSRFKLTQLLSGRREVTDSELLTVLTQLRLEATINRPLHLSQSANLPTAVALRNEICLPDRVFSELSFEHRRALLAHEVAHIARRDAWWLALSLLIERVLFFQPLNRFARIQLSEIAEFLCDDWAVSHTGRHLTFAECLAEVAGWIVQGKSVPQTAPSFASRDSQLIQRVERVLAPRSSTPGGHLMTRTTIAIAGLLVFSLAAPGFAHVRAPAAAPVPAFADEAGRPDDNLTFASEDPIGIIGADDPTGEEPSVAAAEPSPRAESSAGEGTPTNFSDAPTPEDASTASPPSGDLPVDLEPKEEDGAVQDTVDTRVVQSLINALGDDEAVVRREAVQALGELRATAAIPALGNALSDEDPQVRRYSVSALSRMRNPAALPALTRALQDESANVRGNAIDAILSTLRNIDSGNREARASEVAPALTSMLRDPSPGVRRKAISAVATLGLRETVTSITTLLRDSTPDVRVSAASALGRLQDSTVVPALTTALRDSVPGVRHAAIRSLARFPSAQLVPAFSSALSDTNADVREVAATALGRLESQSAVEPLLVTLRDTDSDVREAGIRALVNLEARTAIGPISGVLNDPSSDVREIAVRAIGELGDSTSYSAVLPALRDSVAEVRRYAVRTAASLGGVRAAPSLRAMLNDPSPEVRAYTARALGSLKDAGSVPALTSALSDSNAEVRQAAVRSLGEIQTPSAADGFVAALNDDDSNVRRYAVRGLASLNDSRFVPPIIDALRDGSSTVRAEAASALGRLRDSRARDALIAATEDADADVRRAAIRALSRIR